MADIINLTKYDDFFCQLWPETKPLFRLFRTENKGYLYDTGTNKIFACSNLEFDILNYFAQYEVKEAINIMIGSYPPDELFKALDKIKSNICSFSNANLTILISFLNNL